MVKNQVKRFAFLTLFENSLANKKTKHIWYSILAIQPYVTSLDPETARSVFEAYLNMYEIKANFKKMYESDFSCPFCKTEDEIFKYSAEPQLSEPALTELIGYLNLLQIP